MRDHRVRPEIGGLQIGSSETGVSGARQAVWEALAASELVLRRQRHNNDNDQGPAIAKGPPLGGYDDAEALVKAKK